MNKLALSALAATLVMGTTNASDGDWTGLDAELSALSSALTFEGGVSIGGHLEAVYDTDSDVADDMDIGRNRLTVSGDNFHVGFDVDGYALRDAYMNFTLGGFEMTAGQFRRPTTYNHLEKEADRHFLDRSALGTTATGDGVGGRVDGLMATGSTNNVGWNIHIDDAGLFTGRFSYDLMSSDDMNLSVAYSVGETTAIGDWFEAHLTAGDFSLSATMGDDDGTGTGAIGGDSASVYVGSYQVSDNWTIGVRQTDHDDGADATMDAALTCDCGGARWTFQQNDDDDLLVGCIVGF